MKQIPMLALGLLSAPGRVWGRAHDAVLRSRCISRGSRLKRPGSAESEGNPRNQPHGKDIRPIFILPMN